jgi:hypothetical protein
MTPQSDEDRRAARRIAYIDAITRLVSVCQPTFRVGLVLVAYAQFAHGLHL